MLAEFLLNLRGKNTRQKILIIESDDWGSIRMPSKNVYERLLHLGIPVNQSAYCKFDTLESNQDLSNLLEVLSKVKNARGESPKLTANYVVNNPDFQRIKEENYTTYFSEPITKTFTNHPDSSKTLIIAKEGLDLGIFKPQFHGKEHLNVPFWLQLLSSNDDFKFAFECGLWGLSKDVFPNMSKSVQATYHSNDDDYIKESITAGLNQFEEIFGFRSRSFIPNNYIFPVHLVAFLSTQGINVLQGMKYLLSPSADSLSLEKIRRKWMRDTFGITHLVRNCRFEPTEQGTKIDQTLQEIEVAFLLRKPAVITSHRINFVGGLSEKNRDVNLIEFHDLLQSIVQKWPDVEFRFSDEVILNIK